MGPTIRYSNLKVCDSRSVQEGSTGSNFFLAVIDSGSHVTTLLEDYFNRNFLFSELKWHGYMNLTAANVVVIPNIGYIICDINICGHVVNNCVVYILKDSESHKEKKNIPAILGTNVLAYLPKFGELLKL